MSSANTKERKEGTWSTTICPPPGGYPPGWWCQDVRGEFVESETMTCLMTRWRWRLVHPGRARLLIRQIQIVRVCVWVTSMTGMYEAGTLWNWSEAGSDGWWEVEWVWVLMSVVRIGSKLVRDVWVVYGLECTKCEFILMTSYELEGYRRVDL